MVINAKIRNNICMNSHPVGCEQEVLNQINYVKSKGKINGSKKALVIGSSTGYGLASRITAAFGCGADTIGLAYEKEGSETRPGTAGWYNNKSFDKFAKDESLVAETINGDAFSYETKEKTIKLIKEKLGKIDLIVYSLASPVRVDPDTGEMYRSALKPIGKEYPLKYVDPMSGETKKTIIEPASDEEINATVKVMGGEDWKLWIKALEKEDLLAENFITVAYSYIGPEMTHPIYREGTIGRAKKHIENTAKEITEELKSINARAYVSVNKALVTRASAVIPVVPLYISILYKIMKEKGIHEGCIEQAQRLFSERLYTNKDILLDEKGLIRIDDWEMREDVKVEVKKAWDVINSKNYKEYCDLDGYKSDFLKLNGFGVNDVKYDEDVSVEQLL